jgi:hypothetical protein
VSADASHDLACDWPGCPAKLTTVPAIWTDGQAEGWASSNSPAGKREHLCRHHAGKGFEELEAARIAATR